MNTYVSVNLPQPLYRRLEQAAARLHKPVQEFLAETLQDTLPAAEQIPEEVQIELAVLEKLDERTLQTIADGVMAIEDQEAFDQLLDLQSMRSLTDIEAFQLERLRTEYGRILLLKARAFALLVERGIPLKIE